MSSELKSTAISEQEYLDRENTADSKSEYFQGEIFAMSGGSPMHSLIAANFVGEARESLKNKPCAVFNSDLRIKILASGLLTYPDASIVCGALEFADAKKRTVVNPTVVVEVLSDSTEQYDRGRKSNHFRQIPSLNEIILISQDQTLVECYRRQDSGGWLLLEERNLDASFEIAAVGISMAMGELYRNVIFELRPSNPTPS